MRHSITRNCWMCFDELALTTCTEWLFFVLLTDTSNCLVYCRWRVCQSFRRRLQGVGMSCPICVSVKFGDNSEQKKIHWRKCLNFDVLYLMYFLDTSVDIKYNNKDVHVSLIPNPSHLEVSNASFIQPYRKELQA